MNNHFQRRVCIDHVNYSIGFMGHQKMIHQYAIGNHLPKVCNDCVQSTNPFECVYIDPLYSLVVIIGVVIFVVLLVVVVVGVVVLRVVVVVGDLVVSDGRAVV